MIKIFEQKQNYKDNLIESMLEIVTQGYGSEGKRIKQLMTKLRESLTKLEFIKKKISLSMKQEKILKDSNIKTEENIARGLSKLRKLIKDE